MVVEMVVKIGGENADEKYLGRVQMVTTYLIIGGGGGGEKKKGFLGGPSWEPLGKY